jgi:hypothetical protein
MKITKLDVDIEKCVAPTSEQIEEKDTSLKKRKNRCWLILFGMLVSYCLPTSMVGAGYPSMIFLVLGILLVITLNRDGGIFSLEKSLTPVGRQSDLERILALSKQNHEIDRYRMTIASMNRAPIQQELTEMEKFAAKASQASTLNEVLNTHPRYQSDGQ